jgi:RES domain-containing protein
MIVYRICQANYKNDLSGKGAEKVGGRWNSTGFAVLYTAGNRSLAMAEMAVSLPFGILPKNYYLLSIFLPDRKGLILELPDKDLPADWKSLPHAHGTQEIGNNFVSERKHLALKVPSAVVQGEFNFIINPAHKAFGEVSVVSQELFDFDNRLFLRGIRPS